MVQQEAVRRPIVFACMIQRITTLWMVTLLTNVQTNQSLWTSGS
jgi:hypothetical protein